MTKNTMKFLGLCLTLAASFVMAPRSYANVDQVSAFYGQLAVSGIRIGGTVAGAGNGSAASTTTVMAQLYYNGSAASSYVSIFASSITFYAPLGTVDTSIPTNSTYGAGTLDIAPSTMTLGALSDIVNGVAGYHMTLVDGIRSDIALNYLPSVTAAANVNNLAAVGGYLVPTSTSAIISLGIIPAANRHVILNYCAFNSTGTPSVQVFGVRAKNGVGANGLDYFGNALNDSSLVWQSPALVQQAATNFPTSTLIAQPWLEFGGGSASAYTYKNAPVGNAYNGHVVVRVNNYGTAVQAQTSSQYVSCNWFER